MMFLTSSYNMADYAVSVPSFGDSFFIGNPSIAVEYPNYKVSVPSFGDSFFI